MIFLRSDGKVVCNGNGVSIKVTVTDSNPPVLNSSTNEDYDLVIASDVPSFIKANTVFGAMRGLETVAQLVIRKNLTSWYLPQVAITDSPRFAFRGFLHDTARHYLSMSTLKMLIDALSASKYNIFHWHIVDDQSFPYVSTSLPKLSEGAYGGLESHTYSQQQVQEVITYGFERGIRVVPEFDTPGHVRAMGVGYPSMVTPCFTNNKPDGTTGPLNPILNSTFDNMSLLYHEIAKVFPDDYIHIGGDEVSFDCWQSNPSVQNFMKMKGWTDYALLEQYYEQNLIKIVEATGKHYVVWQEIFDNGLKIDKHTIVDVWKNDPTRWQDELGSVTKAGFQAILSAPWYLNYESNPYNTDGNWESYYLVEPLNFTGTQQQKDLVIGGEGCMWAEYAGNSNVVSRTWPRAAAVGERLWSPASSNNVKEATNRIQEFQCELVRRGIDAEPVTGPSYCLYELESAT